MRWLAMALWIMVILMWQNIAFANLFINEIMYDLPDSDEGKEWVEVYNSGPESVDLSEYKFFEGDTNHKLVLAQGSPKIQPSGFAVIVSSPEKFKSFYPSFSGVIFDSSFMLSNGGELLALKDKDLNILDQVIYASSMGGAGNGRTVSKIDGTWKEGKATMGAVNQIYFVPPVLKPKVVSAPKIELKDNTVEEKIEMPLLESNAITASVIETQDLPHRQRLWGRGTFVYLIGLFALIILGGGTVYLVRRKKTFSQAGDDFEIVE